MHLLLSELRRFQNARCNDKNYFGQVILHSDPCPQMIKTQNEPHQQASRSRSTNWQALR